MSRSVSGIRATGFDRLLAWLDGEDLVDQVVLDVGTGTGRLALALAPRCRHVIGIDREAAAIEAARAAAAGIGNAEFLVMDAEIDEYGPLGATMVVAHLCMSDAIIERAAHALAPGALLAFVAFHADQWRETGRRSRFAYDEEQARRVLGQHGFAIDRLHIDRDVQTFGSVEEALAAAVALEEKWRTDGRWFHYIKFLEEGGRSLTRSHLVVKARRG